MSLSLIGPARCKYKHNYFHIQQNELFKKALVFVSFAHLLLGGGCKEIP